MSSNKCTFHHLFDPMTDKCVDCSVSREAYFNQGQATFVPADPLALPFNPNFAAGLATKRLGIGTDGEEVHIYSSPNSYNALKCECGSDAVGSPYHSPWCPKYTKPD